MASREGVAEFLIKKGFLLTALEFHQELLEDDGTELDILRSFFADKQPTFDVESPQTLKDRRKGEDGSKTSSGGDRAVLEYELRRAREDITQLRSQLTSFVRKQQPDANGHTGGAEAAAQKQTKRSKDNKENIKDHEQRTLNFLISHFLRQSSYALTAITFSEEVQDNLDDWATVGLDTPEPPPLLSLFRYFFDNEDTGIQGALSKAMTENLRMKRDLTDRTEELRTLKKKTATLQAEADTNAQRVRDLELALEDARKGQATDPSSSSPSTTPTTALNGSSQIRQPKPVELAQDHKYEQVDRQSLFVGDGPLTIRAVYKGLVQKYRMDVAPVLMAGTSSRDPEVDPAKEEFAKEISVRVAKEIDALTKSDLTDALTTLKVVATSLPHVLPGVLLNKREELVPVILSVISQHPDANVRYTLTKLLFNLFKRPNSMQRRMIMSGCVALSTIIGPVRTESEVLTQCWEQMTDKRDERRVLVADSCGSLAAYAPPELRGSLIVSILAQMLDDRSGLVRAAVSRNLAQVINLFDAEGERYTQVEGIFLRLMYDQDQEVATVTRTHLLPAMANWAEILDTLHNKLINTLLNEVQNVLSKGETLGDMYRISDADSKKLALLSSSIVFLIPRLKESILSTLATGTPQDAAVLAADSAEFSKKAQAAPADERARSNSVSGIPGAPKEAPLGLTLMSPKQMAKMQPQLDALFVTPPDSAASPTAVLSATNGKSAAGDWLAGEFVPRLVRIMSGIPSGSGAVASMMGDIVRTLCSQMGQVFTRKVVQPVFVKEIDKDASAAASKMRKSRLLPVYLEGVLSNLADDELLAYVSQSLLDASLEEHGWEHSMSPLLFDAVVRMCETGPPHRKGQVLGILCEQMIKHPSAQARANVANVCKRLMPQLKTDDVAKRVVPALATLTADPDRTVRFCCITALGVVASYSTDDQVLDKVCGLLGKTMDDGPGHSVKMELAHTFGAMLPLVKPRLRDTFVMPRLVELCRRNNANTTNTEHRREMALVLIDAVRAVSTITPLPVELAREHVLPALRLLLLDAPVVDSTFKEMVQSMIADMETIDGGGFKRAPSTSGFLGRLEQLAGGPESGSPSSGQAGSGAGAPPAPPPPARQAPNIGSVAAKLNMSLPKWDWKSS